MRRLVMLWMSILPFLCLAQKEKSYPLEVENVLRKAGPNRTELKKALDFFYKGDDTLKIKAIEFLVANMDIHYSATYYWADCTGKKVPFNELDYPDFAASLQAFEAVKKKHPGIHPVPVRYRDIDSIKGDFLIDNVQRAFEARESPWAKGLSFQDFCEYIMPYRVSIEPFQDWRKSYQQKFAWIGDSAKGKSTEEALRYYVTDFNNWFTNTYGIESRKEPLPRLGAMQLLHRKKGPCENIAALEVFSLRSQGIPASIDEVPFWATSTGKHYLNVTFTSQMKPVSFDVSTPLITVNKLAREPAKVIRTTYSRQRNMLACMEAPENIPEGFMRTTNYKDVTAEYWEVKDVNCSLFSVPASPKTAYACVFNGLNWRPVWWGAVQNNAVVFANLCKGAVFLPMYYIKGKLIPADQIPNAGTLPGARGYADIANYITKEMFEIKSNEQAQISAGYTELANYITKANINCPTTPNWHSGANYGRVVLPWPKDPTKVLMASLDKAAGGVIVYSLQPKINNPVIYPVPIPQSIFDRLKDLVQRIGQDPANSDIIIVRFLQANPEVKNVLIGTAVGIMVATIVEDFLSGGIGILDDAASFALAIRIIRIARKIR